jgi:hypothetical protein
VWGLGGVCVQCQGELYEAGVSAGDRVAPVVSVSGVGDSAVLVVERIGPGRRWYGAGVVVFCVVSLVSRLRFQR